MRSSLQHIVIDIARNSILEEFDKDIIFDKKGIFEQYPDLQNEEACFVTLLIEKNGNNELRGCIGSIVPQTDLLSDIRKNAKAAAFRDPRFKPLSREELDRISIEVSILSQPQILMYDDIDHLRDLIIPGHHGVIIRKNGHKAVFLPSVWEKVNGFDDFFRHLCKKAGLPEECLASLDEVFVFTVQKIAENDSN